MSWKPTAGIPIPIPKTIFTMNHSPVDFTTSLYSTGAATTDKGDKTVEVPAT